jgi:hypothetical protein
MQPIWYKVNERGEVKAEESEMSRKVTAIRKMTEEVVTCGVWMWGSTGPRCVRPPAARLGGLETKF